MSWIVFAFLAPLFIAASVVIDQLMIKDYFKASPTGFLAFAGTINITLLPIIAFIAPAPFSHGTDIMAMIFGLNFLFLLACYPYLKALERARALTVMPMFQMIPVFVGFIGWLFLGESVTTQQAVVCGLILICSIGVGWDGRNGRLRWVTVGLCMIACLLFSSAIVMARSVALTTHWLDMTFWIIISNILCGVILYALSRDARRALRLAYKRGGRKMVAINVLQEYLEMGGRVVSIIALSLAPTATLVAIIESLEPFFVIILSGSLGLLHPKVFDQLYLNSNVMRKLAFTILAFIGVVYLITTINH